MSVPDRWLNYKAVGEQIKGTKFIAFKVPLKNEIVNGFNVDNLLEIIPNLGLVIDLTNTNRYYKPDNLMKNYVSYVKINVPGHDIPTKDIRKSFSNVVNNFLRNNTNSDKLIGVHCTHGINRTGFLICYYMINEMDIEPMAAIELFNTARGYSIERPNYINFLITFQLSKNQSNSPRNSFSNECNDSAKDILTQSERNYSTDASSKYRSREISYRNWRDNSHITPLKSELQINRTSITEHIKSKNNYIIKDNLIQNDRKQYFKSGPPTAYRPTRDNVHRPSPYHRNERNFNSGASSKYRSREFSSRNWRNNSHITPMESELQVNRTSLMEHTNGRNNYITKDSLMKNERERDFKSGPPTAYRPITNQFLPENYTYQQNNTYVKPESLKSRISRVSILEQQKYFDPQK